jgi:hypothetical protein
MADFWEALNQGASAATCNMLAVGTGVAATAAVGNALTLNTWGTLAAGAATLGLGSLHSGLGCQSPFNPGQPPVNNRDRVKPCSGGYQAIPFIVYSGNGSIYCSGGLAYDVPVWRRYNDIARELVYEPIPGSNRCDGVVFNSENAYYIAGDPTCEGGGSPGDLPADYTSYNYTYNDNTTNTDINFQFVGGHIDNTFSFRPTWQATFAPSLNIGPINFTVGTTTRGPYASPPPDGNPTPGPDYPVLPAPEDRCNCPGGGGETDLTEVLAALGELSADVAALESLILVPSGAKDWKLSSPCVKDANGNRIESIIGLPASGDRLTAIMGRLEGLALIHQAAKDLKQPICAGVAPVGQPVTVQFEEI